MRSAAFGVAVLVLVGCKDQEKEATPTVSGINETIASAQALQAAATVQAQTVLTGKVHSEGGTLGSFDIELASCKSGEVNGFFGVDFFVAGTDYLRLRYVHDEAKGEIVKVAYPTKLGTVQALDQDLCAVLDGSIEKTNFKTWTPKGDIRHLNGHLKFDCQADGEGHVTGELTFSHCH